MSSFNSDLSLKLAEKKKSELGAIEKTNRQEKDLNKNPFCKEYFIFFFSLFSPNVIYLSRLTFNSLSNVYSFPLVYSLPNATVMVMSSSINLIHILVTVIYIPVGVRRIRGSVRQSVIFWLLRKIFFSIFLCPLPLRFKSVSWGGWGSGKPHSADLWYF